MSTPREPVQNTAEPSASEIGEPGTQSADQGSPTPVDQLGLVFLKILTDMQETAEMIGDSLKAGAEKLLAAAGADIEKSPDDQRTDLES